MRRRAPVFAAAWTALALPVLAPAWAQEPAGEPGPPAAEAPAESAPEAPPKRKPKPRPKPQAKPQPPPAEDKASDKPVQASREAPRPAPIPGPPPAPSLTATPFAAAPVACEPGQAVQYEGSQGTGKEVAKEADKRTELWVTRSGTITLDNPLRPLTPDVTRVLQVVIGGKVATAYGPDLLSLRRGASPAVLEGTIGGAVRWDAALLNLPDTLPIHAESGQTVAEFRFRACGAAPAARTLPAPKARRTTPTEAEMAAAAAREARESAKEARKANPGAAPKPPGLSLPQGAIP